MSGRSEVELADRLKVDRPGQLQALTSPVRLELIELFGLFGPCSIADIARRMDRAPDSLYYHVRKLQSVGLLIEAGQRPSSRRSESLFRLPAKVLEIPRKSASRRTRTLTHKAIDSVLRLAGRQLKAGLEDDSAPDEGHARTLYGRRLRARVTKKELRELNRHIKAIEAIYAGAATGRSRAGQTVALTVIMTPVPGTRR